MLQASHCEWLVCGGFTPPNNNRRVVNDASFYFLSVHLTILIWMVLPAPYRYTGQVLVILITSFAGTTPLWNVPHFHGSQRIRTCVHTLWSLFVLGCPSALVCALTQRVHRTFKIWLEICATSRLYSITSSLCRFSIFLHIHLAFPVYTLLPYMHSTRLGIVICGSWRWYEDLKPPATIYTIR